MSDPVPEPELLEEQYKNLSTDQLREHERNVEERYGDYQFMAELANEALDPLREIEHDEWDVLTARTARSIGTEIERLVFIEELAHGYAEALHERMNEIHDELVERGERDE